MEILISNNDDGFAGRTVLVLRTNEKCCTGTWDAESTKWNVFSGEKKVVDGGKKGAERTTRYGGREKSKEH